jgi:hypothetical protein
MGTLAKITFLLAASLLICVSGNAYNPQPYYSDENAQYNTVTESYITPHIDWAKPYLDGRPRVLILAPRWGLREAAELMERMDMDARVFAVNSKDALGAPSSPGENEVWEGFYFNSRIHEYEKLLKEKWDAVVLAGFNMTALPFIPETSFLLNKVNDEGMGLLIMPEMLTNNIAPTITHNDAEARDRILKPIPVDEIPVLREIGADKLLYVTKYGKGRIANLRIKGGARGCFTADVSDPVDFEYCLATVIRTLQWVTGKEPGVEISNVEWGKSFDSSSPGTLRFAVDPDKGRGMVPSVTILRQGERTLPEAVVQKDAPVSGKNGVYEWRFPVLPEGRYLFTIHLGTEKYRSTWYSGGFAVTSGAVIDSVTTDRECYPRGGTVNVRVFLKNAPGAGSSVALTLIDGFGRLMMEKSLPAGSGKAPLEFGIPLKDVLHNAMTLTAGLVVNGKTVSSKKRELFAPARGQDDFMFVMWDYYSSNTDRVTKLLAERVWGDYLIDAVDAGPGVESLRSLMRANVRPLPYVTRYFFPNPDFRDPAPVRNPSLSDPEYQKKERENLQNAARIAKDFSPVGYTLGDENNLDDAFSHIRGVDIDFHPASQDSFRVWLKKKYGTLEKLNAVWKTSCASWADVHPIIQADALRTGQYARWIDHREHMEHAFAEIHRLAGDWIREVDPGARVGFDGTNVQNSYHGYNFYSLFSMNTVQNIYDQDEQRELLRSFARKDALTAIWLGSYWAHRSEDQNRRYPWLMLFDGMNSCWYWTMYGGATQGDAMTALAPDLTPAFHFNWALEEIGEIKSGIGKLFMNSSRVNDGIAVHYSPASVHASSLDPAMGFVPFVQENVCNLLEDAGFQYDFVAVPQIEGGALDSGKYKALILPCSQVITEKEEAAIRKFVENGGLLIADVRPGYYGNYGNPSEKGALDDLFGIGRANGERAEPADLTVSGTIGSRQERFLIPGRALDGSISAIGGKALASANGIPAVIMNTRGKGTTVLFNFDITDYSGTQPIPLVYPLPPQGTYREKGNIEGFRSLIRSCMRVAGIEPRIQIETDSGELKSAEITVFTEGGNRYAGILRAHNTEDLDPQTGHIRFPSVSHVYNARTGAYYGKTGEVTETVAPARALLFSLLPYRVDGITVKTPKEVTKGAALSVSLVLQTSKGKPGLHVFHVEVRDPRGDVRKCYSMNVLARNGAGEAKIPLALNDLVGRWTLAVRDAATGCRAEAAFEVK